MPQFLGLPKDFDASLIAVSIAHSRPLSRVRERMGTFAANLISFVRHADKDVLALGLGCALAGFLLGVLLTVFCFMTNEVSSELAGCGAQHQRSALSAYSCDWTNQVRSPLSRFPFEHFRGAAQENGRAGKF